MRGIAEVPDPRQRADDAGFSLIELMVALLLVGMVMTALTSFFLVAINGTNAQSNRQTAVQLVNSALERVRALKGSAVTSGRDQASTVAQWSAAGTAAGSYLTTMAQTWDPNASSGTAAALPTTAQSVTVNNVVFNQTWYVGQCWQPSSGGDCTSTKGGDSIAFYRVVAQVSWASGSCPGNVCTQLAATLVSSAATEPVFKSNETAQAPQVVNPGRQNGELTVPVSLTVTATGGAPPLSWSAKGLPTGLLMESDGKVTGTPTAVGTYSVTVTATDGFNLVGSAAFTWVVSALPVLTNPGNQSSQAGTAISPLILALTGGTSPLSWAATGLPTGLSIDSSSGAITGSPTKVGSYSTTVTVTDTYAKSSTTSFTWTVPALTVATPAAQSGEVSVAVTPLQIVAAGGVPAYSWSASGLPPGLGISSAGVVSGTPTATGAFTPKVTVTDTAGTTATTNAFKWTIIAAPTISWPRGAQSAALGTQFTVQSTATGGTGPYTWVATNVPTGVSMPNNGQFTGPLTAAGRYLTTLKVTDSVGGSDTVVLPIMVTTSTALRITAPTGDNYARTEPRNQPIAALSLTAAGASTAGALTWSASGLPPGVALASGVLSGTPTTAGTYTTTITVVDASKKVSNFMFLWTIT